MTTIVTSGGNLGVKVSAKNINVSMSDGNLGVTISDKNINVDLSGGNLEVTTTEPITDLTPILTAIVMSDAAIYLNEDQSNTGTFDVTLTSQGAATISVTSVNSFSTPDKASITFTAVNWDTPQTVTLTAIAAADAGVRYDNINVGGVLASYRIVDSTISSSIYSTEPLTDTSWTTSADIDQLRSFTTDWIWGSGYAGGDGSLPSELPINEAVHSNDTYATDANLNYTSSIDVFDVPLASGTTWSVKLYKFNPTTPNGKYFIVPTGHGDDWAGAGITNGYELLVENLTQNGYTCLFYYMAGRGPNATDDGITQAQGGRVNGTHAQMAALESGSPYFNPIDYFLRASIVAINYAVGQSATNIYLTGISGGGWTTTWIAFLDKRIEKSFTVAGNYPNYVRAVYTVDSTDYEQGWYDAGDPPDSTTEFIKAQYRDRVTYSDMYCGSAQDREAYQFNNINDSCCYFGYYNTVYKTEINNKLDSIGTFGAFTYNQPGEHTYNQTMITQILNLL